MLGMSNPALLAGAEAAGLTLAVSGLNCVAASTFVGSPGNPRARPAEKAQSITLDQVLFGRPSICAPVMTPWLRQIRPRRKQKIFHTFLTPVLLKANYEL